MREVKDPEVRKREIIEAAKQVFYKKGYSNTTTQDIVDAANISRGLLYYHFKSKEEILYWIVEQQAAAKIQRFEQLTADKKLSAQEKVELFLDATIIPAEQITPENVMLQETMVLEKNTFMMDKIYHKLSHIMTRYFQKIIEQGNAEKIFHVEYPEQVAAYLMTGYIFVINDTFFHDNQMESGTDYLKAFKGLLNVSLGASAPLFTL
jgi:AcrR family transcriptional regulator